MARKKASGSESGNDSKSVRKKGGTRSSKTVKTARVVSSKAAEGNENEGQAEPYSPEKPAKSPLSKKELEHYRKLLFVKRAEILGDMSSMSAEALRMSDPSNLSHMPIHMADIGSDNYEQELTLGLVESERKLLNEIDDALMRIEEGTYGVCQSTGQPINKARLDAKPWAKYCIEAAREMERGGGR